MRRQRLGQHYLVDRLVVEKIITSAAIRSDERVLEIGTGRGVLTKELVRLGASLEGFEIDRENFAATLRELGTSRAVIHLEDAFKEVPRFDVLISSLPYSKSATFIEWISRVEYDRAVVIIQEDFVGKIMAPPGARDYRAISAVAQASSEFNVLMKVCRESFSPPPKVSSLLVLVKPKRRMMDGQISRVKQLFSLRRREVVSAATELGMPLPSYDYGRRRVYSLTPKEVLEICGKTEGQANAGRSSRNDSGPKIRLWTTE